MREPLLIAVGGALGSVLRYWVAAWAAAWVEAAPPPGSGVLPLGVIGINVAGSLLIGFFGTLTLAGGRAPLPEGARLFVMVGFCGGFTTFSSFSLRSVELLRGGAWLAALVNVVGSVLLCLAAVAVGHLAAARMNGGAGAVAQVAREED